jgi:hypothetical protein
MTRPIRERIGIALKGTGHESMAFEAGTHFLPGKHVFYGKKMI